MNQISDVTGRLLSLSGAESVIGPNPPIFSLTLCTVLSKLVLGKSNRKVKELDRVIMYFRNSFLQWMMLREVC